MAWITKEQVAEKRAAIKKAFPLKEGWKFSVRKQHSSSIAIDLMQFPKEYNFKGEDSVNQYWIDENAESHGWGEKEVAVIKKMKEIAYDGHWDESDIQSDYFHCAWYVNLGIGHWDKPAVGV